MPFCPFESVKNGWNSLEIAKIYFHHSEMQRQLAHELLSKVSFKGTEKILDFGCGDGKISSELSRRVNNGSVLGVDISLEMLQLSKIYFPNFAYSNLRFEKSNPLLFSNFSQDEKYDIISSFCVCFTYSPRLYSRLNYTAPA